MKSLPSDEPSHHQKEIRAACPLLISPGRWKWMAKSTAAAGAAVAGTAADGAVVQIDLINNQITDVANTFNPDFTGDGQPDAALRAMATTFTAASTGGKTFVYRAQGLSTSTSSNFVAQARTASFTQNFTIYSTFYTVSVNAVIAKGTTPQSKSGLFPVTFTDARFNGGAATDGFVELLAMNFGRFNHFIQAVRLVFDDANPAEPVGVVAGGTNPSIGSVTSGGGFVPPATPPATTVAPDNGTQITVVRNKVKRLKKKLRRLRGAEKRRLKKKIKKLQRILRALG